MVVGVLSFGGSLAGGQDQLLPAVQTSNPYFFRGSHDQTAARTNILAGT